MSRFITVSSGGGEAAIYFNSDKQYRGNGT